MAVINLALKYAEKAVERFYHESITDAAFDKSRDSEFVGVKTVRIYDIGTAPVNDYQRSGTSRYGSVDELSDSVQELQMTQDKSSTWSIDKGNQKEQFNIKQAGETLQRQLREKYTPMIDKYRMQKWADGAGIAKALTAAPTKSTIVSAMLDAAAALDDAGVPESGRMFFVPTTYYKHILLSDEFSKADALMIKALGKGTVGELFGIPVKKVPTSYMPTDVYFILVFKGSAISPVKLQDYKINTEPQGISGDLVEMRLMYDSFVLGTKADGIYIATATGKVATTPTIAFASNVMTLSGDSDAVIKYTTDGSDPRYSKSAVIYSASAKPTIEAGATVKAAATLTGSYQSGVATKINS